MSVLFVFRRDLRIEDNLALNRAIEFANDNKLKIMLSFCFDEKQIDKNKYFSNNSFQFMIECLEELNNTLSNRLSFFEEDTFYQNIKDVKAIAFNLDYTPYAVKRDDKIIKYCKEHDIQTLSEEDYTLHKLRNINPKTNKIEPFVKTGNNDAYKKFTPFYNEAIKHSVSEPKTEKLEIDNIQSLGNSKLLKKYKSESDKNMEGGRTNGLDILKQIQDGVFKEDKKNRNIVNHPNSTTQLSAFLKFGCVSIREVYSTILKKYGKKAELIRQLYWKEFYANITYFYPHVLEGMSTVRGENKSFTEKYDQIKWDYDGALFKHWCNGKTGIPLVDAGMSQLNRTGFMHNRLRMITASFLVKDLGIDWREGERYFATKLVDYDPASNNGGWQWVSGTGTDANPYFRIFNPWNQMKDYDKDCKYVKKWIPELSDVDSIDIHKWYDVSVREKYKEVKYKAPIVDHYLKGKFDKSKTNYIKEKYMLKKNMM
jgi:deoxyribodipyrimidine photo-lyase